MNWFFLLVYLFLRFRLTPISPLPVLPDLVDAGDPAKQDVDISNVDKKLATIEIVGVTPNNATNLSKIHYF